MGFGIWDLVLGFWDVGFGMRGSSVQVSGSGLGCGGTGAGGEWYLLPRQPYPAYQAIWDNIEGVVILVSGAASGVLGLGLDFESLLTSAPAAVVRAAVVDSQAAHHVMATLAMQHIRNGNPERSGIKHALYTRRLRLAFFDERGTSVSCE